MTTPAESRVLYILVGGIVAFALVIGVWPEPSARSAPSNLDAASERIVRMLYANFDGIETLAFTTRVVFDPPNGGKNAEIKTWVSFDGPLEYTTTSANVFGTRNFEGRVYVEFRSAENNYEMVIDSGLAEVAMHNEHGTAREVTPLSELAPLHIGFDTVFFNHFASASTAQGGPRHYLISEGCNLTVDRETGRLINMQATFDGWPLVSQVFEDFHELEGGFWFPKTIAATFFTQSRNPTMQEAKYYIEDIVVNDPLENAVFQLP